ncbi:response regulator, partial [Anaeromyxobacter oryzisoli]|uniref:response regulator n=1 Tax=Anaeromyxobacter oryzisoli TaxID=2925408 RepID=UPI001F5AEC61
MPKNLLLADDSITIQKVVGITFAKNEDIKVTAVDNGEAAIAKARELKPDLILADVVMPKRNGYEVCEAVKADPALRHIPVLLLAGTFEAFDEARARAARADGHIAKPFESQALIDKVNAILGGKGAAGASAAAARPGPAPHPGAPMPQPGARPG